MERAVILSVFLFSVPLLSAHAQVLGAEPVTVTLSPQYPGAYQTVTVTPGSTIVNLAGATVTISVDGKVIQTGSGTQSASFTTGGPGTSDTVTVSVNSPDGQYQKSVTVRPSSVALIQEPMATTHPFYEGAAQVAIKGRVRLIAMADLRTSAGGTPASAQNLVYTWRLGDQLLTDSSGIGKSVLTLEAPDQYRTAIVTLTVSTQDSSLAGSASAEIDPIDPSMLFYRDDPLLGPNFDTALGSTYSMQGSEESFRAVPYAFAAMPDLTWSVNGATSATGPVITLRPTGQGAGSASLTANASQANTYIGATRQMTIQFGQPTSTGIFGL